MEILARTYSSKGLDYTIRSPRIEDALALSQLRPRLDSETEFLDRTYEESKMSQEDFKELILKDLASPTNLFLLVEVDGRPVGFSRTEGSDLSRYRHKVVFGICILKEVWGHGIGSRLMEITVEEMDRISIRRIELLLSEKNKKALRLYKKFGFKEEGVLIDDRLLSQGYSNTIIMGRIKKD